MTEADPIAAGREAWQRLQQRERATFDDWVLVGQACVIGRSESMMVANCSKPFGRPYLKAMGSWLHTNGLDGIRSQERYWSIALADNLDAIRAWRDTLDERQRRRFNHPQAIWVNWRKSLNAEKPTARREFAKGSKPSRGSGRQVSWPQDAIRRAAAAMRESRSNDLFVLARACLEAAVRNEDDLFDLIEPTSSPKPVPTSPSAAISAPAVAA